MRQYKHRINSEELAESEIVDLYIHEGIENIPARVLSPARVLITHENARLIYIPDSVKTVDEDIFSGWPGLKYVIAPEHLKKQIYLTTGSSFIEATYIWHNEDGSYTDDFGTRYEIGRNEEGRITRITKIPGEVTNLD